MFKKMVKKIMGFIIGIVLLCSNLFSINVQAANAFYTEQGENLLEYLQTEYPSMLQLNSNYAVSYTHLDVYKRQEFSVFSVMRM